MTDDNTTVEMSQKIYVEKTHETNIPEISEREFKLNNLSTLINIVQCSLDIVRINETSRKWFNSFKSYIDVHIKITKKFR